MGARTESSRGVRASRRLAAEPDGAGPLSCASCAFRQSGGFCPLGSTALQALESAAASVTLPPRTPLFCQGEAARCVFLVCSGYVKLAAGMGESQRFVVRTAGPGTLLGLSAVLQRTEFEVSAESLTTAYVRAIEKETLLLHLAANVEALSVVARCLSDDYRFALQSAGRVALAASVTARIARVLLDLSVQIGQKSPHGETSYPLLLTHEELASMAVTTRETVSRTLSQFRKKGWIALAEGQITLTNSGALATRADSPA